LAETDILSIQLYYYKDLIIKKKRKRMQSFFSYILSTASIF